MNDLIRGHIKKRQATRNYREYLQRKVDDARTAIDKDMGVSNDEVEKVFSARRRQVLEE